MDEHVPLAASWSANSFPIPFDPPATKTTWSYVNTRTWMKLRLLLCLQPGSGSFATSRRQSQWASSKKYLWLRTYRAESFQGKIYFVLSHLGTTSLSVIYFKRQVQFTKKDGEETAISTVMIRRSGCCLWNRPQWCTMPCLYLCRIPRLQKRWHGTQFLVQRIYILAVSRLSASLIQNWLYTNIRLCIPLIVSSYYGWCFSKNSFPRPPPRI